MKNDAMSTKLREGPMSSAFSDHLRDALEGDPKAMLDAAKASLANEATRTAFREALAKRIAAVGMELEQIELGRTATNRVRWSFVVKTGKGAPWHLTKTFAAETPPYSDKVVRALVRALSQMAHRYRVDAARSTPHENTRKNHENMKNDATSTKLQKVKPRAAGRRDEEDPPSTPRPKAPARASAKMHYAYVRLEYAVCIPDGALSAEEVKLLLPARAAGAEQIDPVMNLVLHGVKGTQLAKKPGGDVNVHAYVLGDFPSSPSVAVQLVAERPVFASAERAASAEAEGNVRSARKVRGGR